MLPEKPKSARVLTPEEKDPSVGAVGIETRLAGGTMCGSPGTEYHYEGL